VAAYWARWGWVAPARAATDAITTLVGACKGADQVEVHRRVCVADGRVIVDLGRDGGQVLAIGPDGWEVRPAAPEGVWFTRGPRSGELPAPVRDPLVGIDRLWAHLRVVPEAQPMLLAWLIAAWRPDRENAIVLLEGPAGAAKSTTARRLLSLVDPVVSAAGGLRSPPKDEDALKVSLSSTRGIAFDNLASIPAWMSDMLCQAVTGGDTETRRLFTDADVVAVNIQAAVILTGLGFGTLRGDLASRVIPVELDRLDETDRRERSELDAAWEADRPALLGALADLTVQVMVTAPGLTLARRARVADYGRILAGVDAVLGTDGHAAYLAAGEALQAAVADDDCVAKVIVSWVHGFDTGHTWSGTTERLLGLLNGRCKWTRESPAPRYWPTTAGQLGKRLPRIIDPLRTAGVEVTRATRGRERTLLIRRLAETSPPSPGGEQDAAEVRSAPAGPAGALQPGNELVTPPPAAPLDDYDDDEPF
jgi:hypothetical protein